MLFDFENNVCHMSQSTFNTTIPQKTSFRMSLKILISSWNIIDDEDYYTDLYAFSINFKSYLLF